MVFMMLDLFSYGQLKSTLNIDSIRSAYDKNVQTNLGKPYTVFSVQLNGKEYSNTTLKGKRVFINFWFAGCAPCMAEMEELNQLYKKFSAADNFAFVSFTFDNEKQIAEVKKEYKIEYPILSISQSECSRLNFNAGYPTSILLDSSGKVQYIHNGGQNGKEAIHTYFTQTVYPLIEKAL